MAVVAGHHLVIPNQSPTVTFEWELYGPEFTLTPLPAGKVSLVVLTIAIADNPGSPAHVFLRTELDTGGGWSDGMDGEATVGLWPVPAPGGPVNVERATLTASHGRVVTPSGPVKVRALFRQDYGTPVRYRSGRHVWWIVPV